MVRGGPKGEGLDGKVVVQVRCNEYTMRDRNPHVPWSPEEIAADAAACREAGASVVHFHARHPETGAPAFDAPSYADVIAAVRAATDVVVIPTLGASTIPDPARRVAHIPELARDPGSRPDLAPVDLGSFNIDPYDRDGRRFRTEELVYATSVAGLRQEIEAIVGSGVGVQSVLWSVGSARLLGAFLDCGLLAEPVYAEIMLAEGWLSTHPGTVRGMQTMVEFLPAERQVHWSVSCYGGSLLGLVTPAVEAGGHVSIGLGDHPYLELGMPTNAEVVAEVVRMIRLVGREPASPAEVRDAFGLAQGTAHR